MRVAISCQSKRLRMPPKARNQMESSLKNLGEKKKGEIKRVVGRNSSLKPCKLNHE